MNAPGNTGGYDMIRSERLIDRLEQLAHVGAVEGHGVTRLALTPEDRRGRQLAAEWMRQAGMSVRTDDAGNLIGRYQGRHELPPVLLMSHLDTVPNGGKYDGTLGVLGAVEVCQAFADEGYVPRYPVEVVNFTMEESSRFGLSMLGSKAVAGKLRPGDLDHWHDKNGVSLCDAMRGFGLEPKKVAGARFTGPYTVGLELHIEQGQRLANSGVPLGIVNGIAAPTRLKLHIVGEAMHSGASVLEDRKDALVAGAEIITEVVKLTHVINVVPGEAELGVDVRGVAMDSRRRLVRAIEQTAARVAARRGMTVRMEITSNEKAVQMTPVVVEQLQQICAEQGWPHETVVSMAGHDVMQLPIGLIFIRNVSGTSHSPQENVAEEDIRYGLSLLYEAVRHFGENGLC